MTVWRSAFSDLGTLGTGLNPNVGQSFGDPVWRMTPDGKHACVLLFDALSITIPVATHGGLPYELTSPYSLDLRGWGFGQVSGGVASGGSTNLTSLDFRAYCDYVGDGAFLRTCSVVKNASAGGVAFTLNTLVSGYDTISTPMSSPDNAGPNCPPWAGFGVIFTPTDPGLDMIITKPIFVLNLRRAQ